MLVVRLAVWLFLTSCLFAIVWGSVSPHPRDWRRRSRTCALAYLALLLVLGFSAQTSAAIVLGQILADIARRLPSELRVYLPSGSREWAYPGLVATWGSVFVAVAIARHVRLRRLETPQFRCLRCGYVLHDSLVSQSGARCPECGYRNDASDLRDHVYRQWLSRLALERPFWLYWDPTSPAWRTLRRQQRRRRRKRHPRKSVGRSVLWRLGAHRRRTRGRRDRRKTWSFSRLWGR